MKKVLSKIKSAFCWCGKKLKSLFWGDEKLKGGSPLLIIMMVLTVATLLISNTVANKAISLFGWTIEGFELTLPAAVLLFPINYIISDLLSGVWGFSASRRANWIAFGCNVLMVGYYLLADIIPGTYYQTEITGYTSAFHMVLGMDGGWGPLGILIASLLAYIVGSWVDDLVFEKIRQKISSKEAISEHKGKFILAAVSSSFAGEICDSLIFLPLLYLFAGMFGTQINSFWQLIAIVGIQAGIKTLYELLISPVTAIIAKKCQNYENHRQYLSNNGDM